MLCRNIGIISRGELIEDTSMKALLKKLDVETFILDLSPDSQVKSLEGVNWTQVDDHTLEVEVSQQLA